MMSAQFQTIAQIAIGRILNSLPEGLLVALFAWVTLRLLPRQNSGTRFAVWFVALLTVAALPLIGSIVAPRFLLSAAGVRPLITLPGPWGILLFLAWVLAVCAAMLRLAAGLWRLRGLRRGCIAIDPAQLEPAIRKTVGDFSSLRRVTLATSENVSVGAARTSGRGIEHHSAPRICPSQALGRLDQFAAEGRAGGFPLPSCGVVDRQPACAGTRNGL
jgi:hypothetical protein